MTWVVASARVEHAQKVGERGDGADGRARRRDPTLLLQRHGGWEAVDRIYCGDSELVEEPPGVGRDRFKITALRFGVECSERERGLPRAGDTGEDHERVAWNIDVDVTKIVLASAANPDDAIAV
jgi:hypothetical protein